MNAVPPRPFPRLLRPRAKQNRGQELEQASGQQIWHRPRVFSRSAPFFVALGNPGVSILLPGLELTIAGQTEARRP